MKDTEAIATEFVGALADRSAKQTNPLDYFKGFMIPTLTRILENSSPEVAKDIKRVVEHIQTLNERDKFFEENYKEEIPCY
jgi:hypothetical protein